jgi:hypothetical protein
MSNTFSRALAAVRSHTSLRTLALVPVFAISAATLAACSDDDPTSPAVATTITVSSGNNQTVAPSAAAALPLKVKVADQYAANMSGQTVTWTITAGTGTLSSATSTTDASGIAQVTYTAGTAVGATTVTAKVGTTLTTTFAITVAVP